MPVIREQTPFPHDADHVVAGAAALTIAHLYMVPQYYHLEHAIQFPERHRRPAARPSYGRRRAESHAIARQHGISILSNGRYTFGCLTPHLNSIFRVAGISGHAYGVQGKIIHFVRHAGKIVAKGDANILNISELVQALWNFWKLVEGVPAYCVRRLYAFKGCFGPWRAPMLTFLDPGDQLMFLNYPDLGEAIAELVWKADFERAERARA